QELDLSDRAPLRVDRTSVNSHWEILKVHSSRFGNPGTAYLSLLLARAKNPVDTPVCGLVELLVVSSLIGISFSATSSAKTDRRDGPPIEARFGGCWLSQGRRELGGGRFRAARQTLRQPSRRN